MTKKQKFIKVIDHYDHDHNYKNVYLGIGKHYIYLFSRRLNARELVDRMMLCLSVCESLELKGYELCDRLVKENHLLTSGKRIWRDRDISL